VERGIDGSKIDVITNGLDVLRFKPREKDEELLKSFGLEGKFVAGYIGTHGMAHALETLLDAVPKIGLNDEDFRLILLGNGARKVSLVQKAKKMQLDNVIFLDSVPKEEVVRYWSLLDVSIIHLKKTPLFTNVIPSKLFECMGMGIPVLQGVEGESADIVEKEKVGLTFEPENDKELVEKLLKLKEDNDLYEQLKVNCIAAAPQYDRAVLAGGMLKILEEIVGR
jgi:glycosyltransferase involved in cell wall biosynthesis